MAHHRKHKKHSKSKLGAAKKKIHSIIRSLKSIAK